MLLYSVLKFDLVIFLSIINFGESTKCLLKWILIWQRCAKRNVEHDAAISRYYERLATVQARGSQASHQVLRDVLREVQVDRVPRTLLKEWATHTFPSATDYWTFRKNVGIPMKFLLENISSPTYIWEIVCWGRILVQVTIYRRLLIGQDGHLDQSEAYDIL